MFSKDRSKVSFFGVAIFLILAGATIFSLGIVMWLFNYYGDSTFSVPSQKIIGGLTVLALGYVVVEMELLRKK